MTSETILCLRSPQVVFPNPQAFNWRSFAVVMMAVISIALGAVLARVVWYYHAELNTERLLNFALTEKTTGPMVRLVGDGYACQTAVIPEELEQAVGAWCEQGGTILLEAKRILAERKK